MANFALEQREELCYILKPHSHFYLCPLEPLVQANPWINAKYEISQSYMPGKDLWTSPAPLLCPHHLHFRRHVATELELKRKKERERNKEKKGRKERKENVTHLQVMNCWVWPCYFSKTTPSPLQVSNSSSLPAQDLCLQLLTNLMAQRNPTPQGPSLCTALAKP